MPFILRIHSYRNQPTPTPLSRRFDAAGGSIGRTADNDLVLDDPSKSISRKHARIDCRDGHYYLTDIGSNPSLINELALGSGKEARLNDGDRITIGDYLIEAVFEPEAGAVSKPSITRPLPPPPLFPPTPQPTAGMHTQDLLAGAGILGDALEPAARANVDPLGLDLFGGVKPDPLSNAFRGADSDHVSPELQAFPLSSGNAPAPQLAIPDDYDPLADYRPAAAARVAVPSPHSAHQAGDAHAHNEVMQALLRGLGLPALKTSRSASELAELIGTMLREAVGGIMGVLVARSMMKRESRIEMTMMAAQANNPLKFFPDAESALKQMLTNELAGYMSPQKAVGVAFDDLKSHELATIAGMRAALAGVLQRFDPAAIEKQMTGASVMDAMLAANRKAKMWDRMVELYADVAREADDDFQRVFGEQFSAAYEEQVERLRNSQSR
jgi:type VI secretion system FHA domain protein